ncbi:MAG: hypothetical protein GWO22_34525, partial [Actinobacteria bacterium]|nr:hypothetical protein [Actinomycetota bacterium]
MREHECPRCHRAVELPIGELCEGCRSEIRRKASRVARWVAVATTLAVALWVLLRLPDTAAPSQRIVGAMGIVFWYVLT